MARVISRRVLDGMQSRSSLLQNLVASLSSAQAVASEPKQRRVSEKNPEKRNNVRSNGKVSANKIKATHLHPKRPVIKENPILVDFKKSVMDWNISKEVKDECADTVLKQIDKLDTGDIAIIFNVCKRGHYLNKKLFESLANVFLEDNQKVVHLELIPMSMLIQSLGMLWKWDKYSKGFFAQFEELMNVLIRECLNREESRYKEFNEQSVANTVHGLGAIYKPYEGLRMGYEVGDLLYTMLDKVTSEDRIVRISSQGISTIFHGCANMEYKNVEAYEKLCKEVTLRLKRRKRKDQSQFGGPDSITCQTISNIVWSLGKLGFRNQAVLDALAKEIVAKVADFNDQGLFITVFGLGQLGYKNRRVVSALSGEIRRKERLMEFIDPALSSIVHNLGELDHPNDGAIKDIGEEVARRVQLGRFSGIELANIVLGFGKLGFTNDGVLGVLCDEIRKESRIQEFKEHDIGNIIVGLGMLKHNDKGVLDVLSRQLINPSRVYRFKANALPGILSAFVELRYLEDTVLHALAEEMIKPKRLSEFKENHLARILQGFGRVGYKKEDVLGAIVREIGKDSRLNGYKGNDCALIVDGMGKLGHFDAKLMKTLLERFGSSHETASTQDALDMVYGLAKIQSRMDHGFMCDSVAPVLTSLSPMLSLKSHLENVGPVEASNLCLSLSALRYYDSALLDCLIDQCQEFGDAKMGLESLGVLHACALFNHPSETFVQGFMTWFGANLASVSVPRHATNALWSLSAIGVLSGELFETLCSHLVGMGSRRLTMVESQQLLSAWSHVGPSMQGKLGNEDVMKLVEDSKSICRTRSYGHSGKDKHISEVSGVLHGLGIDHDCRKELHDGTIIVDIVMGKEEPIALDVGVPTDYTINKIDGKFKELGNAVFRQRLVESRGYKVIHLHFYEWEGMDAKARTAWIAEHL